MRSIPGNGVSLLLSDTGGLVGLIDHEPLSDTTIFPSVHNYKRPFFKRRPLGQQAHYPPDSHRAERHTARSLKKLSVH